MGLLKCSFIVCSCYLFTKSYQKYVFVFFIHITLLGLPNNQPVAIFFFCWCYPYYYYILIWQFIFCLFIASTSDDIYSMPSHSPTPLPHTHTQNSWSHTQVRTWQQWRWTMSLFSLLLLSSWLNRSFHADNFQNSRTSISTQSVNNNNELPSDKKNELVVVTWNMSTKDFAKRHVIVTGQANMQLILLWCFFLGPPQYIAITG